MPRLVALLALLVTATARAEPLVVDGGLLAARPAALDTGLSTGVGAGVLRGGALAWGARASWSSATEYTLSWAVRHDDFRLRVLGALQHVAGRGTLALRAGAGVTAVHERRTREQGQRAGLEGDQLQTSGWAFLPALDLEGVVALRLVAALSLELAGGPSLELRDGAARVGWVGALGVAWQL